MVLLHAKRYSKYAAVMSPWGKSTAAQKVMAHVIVALLIPDRKYFPCEIKDVCLFVAVLYGPFSGVTRAHAAISIIITAKLC